MMNEKQTRLLAWLQAQRGEARVARALACGWFRDAIAIAAELGHADAQYFATNVLATALGEIASP